MRGGVDKKMINYKRLMKNSKAISPIFATLILIAIAVIAGIVVYMFTSGTLATMTGGGTAAQEKATVQGLSFPTTGTYAVYAQATSGSVVNVTSIIFKDTSGATLGVDNAPAAAGLPADGTLATITGTIDWGTYAPLAGAQYTATLVTAKGGSFVSPAAPMPSS
jgi:flagellin-like protein